MDQQPGVGHVHVLILVPTSLRETGTLTYSKLKRFTGNFESSCCSQAAAVESHL